VGNKRLQTSSGKVWQLAANQHGVVSRRQLLAAGFTSYEIHSRSVRGRLHRVFRGVYAVGRPQLTQHGWWMAAALSCGPDAVLSHESAAALWRIRPREKGRRVDISIPPGTFRRREGLRIRRRNLPDGDLTRRDRIPITGPARTLVDLATLLTPEQLEGAVNEADKLALIDPEALRAAVDAHQGFDGVAALRKVLDRRTFALTDSELERRFLRLVRRAGLPPPRTRERANGFQVDFFWPELGLVVETDGLRYHRTPAQQAKDRRRDQAHTAAGRTPLRFTHAQVRFEPRYVAETLATVVRRLVTQIAATGGRPPHR
jgi:very-short-patch-repair endonuclease